MFGYARVVVATVIVRHELHVTILWLPALLIPQLIFTLGAAWLVASLGVFLRDIAQGSRSSDGLDVSDSDYLS